MHRKSLIEHTLLSGDLKNGSIQSHFSGCSEFVNFDMVVTVRLTVLLPQIHFCLCCRVTVLNLHLSNSIFWRLNNHILFPHSKHSPLLSISKTCLPQEFKILHPLHPNYFPAFSLSLSFCIQPIKISLTTPSE